MEAAGALPPLRHYLCHPGQWSLGIYPPEFLQIKFSFTISRHLKSNIYTYTAGAPSGHLPHWLAVLRPGRGVRVPPGPDGPCYPGTIYDDDYDVTILSPGCPGGVTAPPPGPAPQLPPAVPDPGPGAGPHHNLGGSLRLALHQVS